MEYDFFVQMILLLPFLDMADINVILEAIICILEWLEIEKRKSYHKKFEDLGFTFATLINFSNESIRCKARKICELCKIWLARGRSEEN